MCAWINVVQLERDVPGRTEIQSRVLDFCFFFWCFSQEPIFFPVKKRQKERGIRWCSTPLGVFPLRLPASSRRIPWKTHSFTDSPVEGEGYPEDPWDERYIYHKNHPLNVGKYTVRPMDPSWVRISSKVDMGGEDHSVGSPSCQGFRIDRSHGFFSGPRFYD